MIPVSSPVIARHTKKYLSARGIETREFFIPLHRQPALTKRGLFANTHYPVAENVSARGLCLPSGLTLPDTDIADICTTLKSSL